MDAERIRAGLSALGNPTRFAAVEIIARAGDAGTLPSALAEQLGIDRNLVSSHLFVLDKAGLITAEVQGRNRIYRLIPQAFRALAAHLTDWGDAG